MTLAEIITEVYGITNRPDRVAETLSAVKSATLAAHQSDYYWKDIFETAVAFDSAEYVQEFNYRALLPNFRAIKYMRKYDYVNNCPMDELSLIIPENIFDGYLVQKQDIYYMAGQMMQINSSTQEQYYLMGCYLNPILTTDGYNSWIADDHPYAIVFDACAKVFKAIGKDEEASIYETKLLPTELANLRNNNVVAAGY